MSTTLQPGAEKTSRITIDTARTISFMGDEGRVYATPELVRDIEITSRDLINEHIGKGLDSVGTHISIDHMAATPLGMYVDITVKVVSVEGPKVKFTVSARDPLDQVCKGDHERFVVDVQKTFERLKRKIAKAAEA